jgi:threonine dehydrogenase-like Zn-dependent dehydrogenase
MRAMAIVAPGRAEPCEVPQPVPGPNQVRLRVEGCGVCASNLGPWQGLPWLRYPLAPALGGHEAWGTVEEAGPGAEALVGARVAVLGDAGWAEHVVVDAAVAVRLPDALDDQPFPGEAFACAFNVFARSRIAPGDTVAIVGIGFLGAVLCRLASDAGATVIAVSRRDSSLALARDHGAAHTVRMDDHFRVLEEVQQLTGGRMCARSIEAVGLQWPLDLASELTAERGTLVIAGYHQDGPRQVNVQSWNWRGIDVVNAHERDPRVVVAGMRRAIDAVVEGRLHPRALVTHTYALEALGQALDDTAGKPDGFVKGAVFP